MVEQETPGSSAPAPARPTASPGGAGAQRFGPFLLVAVSMAWGLWELRPELRAVPYLDDSSLHQQMVRVAAARIRQGHLPLTSWFPYLGLGSPQFLHYQSLPSMVSGLAGTVVNPDTVFRWSLYLLLALWPITVYWSGRLFGLSRWTAAAAAAVAPFLASAAGIGYETKAYVWVGYGVWTQLWASWTLPLAWGFTYRALSSLRGAFWAVLFIMLTVALHYETGYLAFVPLVVWPFIAPSDLWRRIGRAVALGAAAVLASAWVIVPLLAQSHWAARNQVLEGTGLENGYGAGQMLSWLLTGNLYDNGHSPSWLPVITILVAVGIGVCLARWRSFVAGRALVVIWVVTLVLSFGRTTFGSLYDVVPGSSDIFIRRFEMAPQLSGILLAGVGLVFLGQLVVGGVLGLFPEDRHGWVTRPAGRGIVAGLCIGALILVLAPAWSSMDTYDAHNATNISFQAEDDALAGPPARPVVGLRAGPSQGARVRGRTDELGTGLLGGRRPGVQVPGEQGRRRGGLHPADGVAHDRSRVLLRREQSGRLPAVRHRLHHHPRRHGVAGRGRQGRLLWGLLPVGTPRPRLHPRLRHDRGAHGHPGRCRTQSEGAGLPASRRATGFDGGLQRAGRGSPEHDGRLGPPGHPRTRGGRARRPARGHGERRGAHDAPSQRWSSAPPTTRAGTPR